MARRSRGRLIGASVVSVAALLAVTTATPASGANPSSDRSHGSRTIKVTVTEGTSMAVTAASGGRTIVMDLQGILHSVAGSGGTARAFGDPLLDPFWPDLSPDGGSVAVQSFADGMFHIWTVSLKNGTARQLTSGEYDDLQPAWSPDGSKIAFSSARAGNGDIWIVDVANGQLKRVTSASVEETQPTWSPDGKSIAYVRENVVESVDLATGAVKTLVPSKTGALAAPSWSPDGGKIAFLRTESGARRLKVSSAPGEETTVGDLTDVYSFPPSWISAEELLYSGNGKIVVSKAATGETRRVPFAATFTLERPVYDRKEYDFDSNGRRDVRGIVGPALSPDGREVLYKALNDLWVQPVGRGNARKLTDDDFYEIDPVWSRDGKKIAYASDKGGTMDLWVRELSNGREHRVTSLPGAEIAPAWSPDGKRLVFQDQGGKTFLVNADGGAAPAELLGTRTAPGRPSWSADGRTVALSVSAGSRNQIELVNVEARTSKVVEPAPWRSISVRGDDGPAWSPDGRWFAFIMETTLWVLPVNPDGTPAGQARRLTDKPSDAPSWSGDSKTLLYLENGELRTISRDGGRSNAVKTGVSYQPAQPKGRVVIHAGKMWDGKSDSLRANVDITVVKNRITDVSPHRPGPHPPGWKVIDASDRTVMPGLIDIHYHQQLQSKFYGDRQGRLLLSYGITTTRSTGDQAYRAVEDREAAQAGARIGPRHFLTGEMLEGSRLSWDFARPVMNERQLDLEFSRAKALDFDLMKTYMRFPFKMQAEVAKRGHKLGIPTTSHYLSPGIGHGVDMQEHLSGPTRYNFSFSRNVSQGVVYDDVVKLLGKGGFPLSTTLFASSALLADDPGMVDDPRVKSLYTGWEQDILDGELKCALGTGPCGFLSGNMASAQRSVEQFKKIMDAGGTVLAGTDGPLDNPAVSLHLNLRSMVKFGISPVKTLQSATLANAKALGIENDLGSVERGKLADLMFIEGDPLADINSLANVRDVMTNGMVHNVTDLMAPFSGERATASPTGLAAPQPSEENHAH
ncbi:amidohydrolase family protein [Spongiactinospora sp. TRM90649]|uniref:amidohydrolase family protein n=1 Tax=Spongiactinospora sp. TRM90649 TaxID=3031114 RepID=UPI0023F81274|nr:amidohydrolase family protein [Spongiactinospora sp. TRM90649]MDF5757669.1 amidohydrolase family protein [Spongiactinospora sp. TRM90649]